MGCSLLYKARRNAIEEKALLKESEFKFLQDFSNFTKIEASGRSHVEMVPKRRKKKKERKERVGGGEK